MKINATQSNTLDQYVATLTARIPAAGDRAERAAEMVRAGKAGIIGQQGGKTYYRVGRYTPTLEGGCTCSDAAEAAPRANGKPLCQHRIAAMFAHRLAEEKIDGLAAILAAAPADAERVNIRVSVIYTYNRESEQANTVEGYIYPGAGRRYTELYPTEYTQANPGALESFRIRFAELHAALARAGWAFDSKARQGATREIWSFRRQDERAERLGGAISTRIGAVAA